MSNSVPKSPNGERDRVARSFIEATRKPETDLTSIREAIAELADRAVIESFDAAPEAVVVDRDGRFVGEGTVYLSLEYPQDVIVGEELPVSFEGAIDPASGAISFGGVRVDLSPLSDLESEAS